MNSDQSKEVKGYEGWCILELLGHRRLAGFVRQVDMFGAAMCRIDVPNGEGPTVATQFYGGASIYCMTPTTEEIARAVAAKSQPAPATLWEIRPAIAPPIPEGDQFRDEDDDDGPCDPEDDSEF